MSLTDRHSEWFSGDVLPLFQVLVDSEDETSSSTHVYLVHFTNVQSDLIKSSDIMDQSKMLKPFTLRKF